jgi:Tfp pilus assembly pilus retraction ATPase PilT
VISQTPVKKTKDALAAAAHEIMLGTSAISQPDP